MSHQRVFVRAGLVAAAILVAGSPAEPEQPILGKRQARIFQQACAHCHVRPGIGVPLVGDSVAWEERRSKGFEVLLANTVSGIGGMPPLGTCSFCTEEDFRRLVAFVAGLPLVLGAEGAKP